MENLDFGCGAVIGAHFHSKGHFGSMPKKAIGFMDICFYVMSKCFVVSVAFSRIFGDFFSVLMISEMQILSEEIEETKIQIQSVEMFSESFENGCRNDETGTFDLESATLPQFEHKKSIILWKNVSR